MGALSMTLIPTLTLSSGWLCRLLPTCLQCLNLVHRLWCADVLLSRAYDLLCGLYMNGYMMNND